MKKLALLALLSPFLQAPEGFRDDFSTYPQGSAGAPRWRVLRGEWKVRDGKLAQLADGEGHAIAAPGLERGAYRLEARFRTVAGIPGEGVLFGLKRPDSPGPGHLVRVDPEGLYYGSLDASGEFRGEGPVPALVEGRAWNTLAIVVDRKRGSYRIEFNGRRAAEGLPLEHDGPGIGLVSNWGEQEFALCAVEPAAEGPADSERASPTSPARPAKPVDLAAAPGVLLVLDREAPTVRVFRSDLAPAGSFGRLEPDDRPIAIAVGPGGAVHVLDESSGRIDRYPAEGGPPEGDPARIAGDTAPRTITASPPLRGPRGLAVLPDGRIAVAETAAAQVAILSGAGERVDEVGTSGDGGGKLERPVDVAVDARGRLLIADFKACRVLRFAPGTDGKFRFEARSPWMAPPGRLEVTSQGDVAVLGRFAYYETGGAVRLLGGDLLPKGFAGVFASGNLSEEGGLALGKPKVDQAGSAAPGEVLHCLSRRDGRLYRFPAQLSGEWGPRPGCEHRGGSTRVSWSVPSIPGTGPAGPRLQFRREGSAGWAEAATEGSGPYSADLQDLDPLSAYQVRFQPHADFVQLTAPDAGAAAGDTAWSKPYRLYGPEPPGRLRYLDLSILAVVYPGYQEAGRERKFTLPREQLGEKLEREWQVARAFFARNTGLRLHVHAEFEVIEGGTAVVKNGWLDPALVRRDVAPLIEKRGKKVEDYDSLIGMWAEPGWQADAPDDPGTVGGGGLTSFGYSSYGIGGRAAWLFCHEYHHQIDAFFNRSGHLDYPLNHPDPTVQRGRYGQHWDCNAFFLRGWGREEWFYSRFGRVLYTDDADGDRVPDRDDRLPIDEARSGSDPAKADTDGDGLSDLSEMTAGTFRGTDPRHPDTDGDGVPDGKDPRPLDRAFGGAPELAKGAPALDGKLAAGEWQELGAAPWPVAGPTAGAKAAAHARWDGEHLYLAASADRPVRVHFELDAANDGWFLEDDNRMVEIRLDGSASPEVRGAPGARSAGSGGPAAPVAECAIPWKAIPAVRPAGGARFGLCVRVTWREGEGESARERELFLYEPWELLELRLGEN